MTSASAGRTSGADLTPAAAMLTAAGFLWLVLLTVSPVAASRGQFRWMAAIVYHAGSLICHQRPERSFHIDGVQLPVCARCVGLYASGAAGLMLAWSRRRRWSANDTRIALAAASVPIAATVGLELAGAITTTNVVRMLSAVPLGLVGGVVLIAMLRTSGDDGRGRTRRADTL